METKAKHARKANFSSAVCALILQLAEENLETIREKFSSTLTNKKTQEVWQILSEKILAWHNEPRLMWEKWRAMWNEARKEMDPTHWLLEQ